MDHRLVISKDLGENMLRAIHFNNAGRDPMLREASEIWWQLIHREIVKNARNCAECRQPVKKLKILMSPKFLSRKII